MKLQQGHAAVADGAQDQVFGSVDKHADFDNLLPGWPPDSAMIDDNISEFNAQVTRMEFSSGTLTWLFRNGLVTGELNENADFAVIVGAQLSARSYETFIRPEGHTNSKPLGQLAISASSQPGTKEESVVAELVARRLLKD